jgi:hypothetical protein
MCFPALMRSDFNLAPPADPSISSESFQKFPKDFRQAFKTLPNPSKNFNFLPNISPVNLDLSTVYDGMRRLNAPKTLS